MTCAVCSTSTSPGPHPGSTCKCCGRWPGRWPSPKAPACPSRSPGTPRPRSCPAPEYPADLDSGEARTALDRLRFYLRRDVDVDGSTLYRLFHQGLADQLRADADRRHHRGHWPWPGRPGLAAPVRDDPRWPGRSAAVAARRAVPAAPRRPARRRRRPARRPAPGHRLPHPRRPGRPGPAARGPARRRRRRSSRHLPRLLRRSLPAVPGGPRSDPGRRRGPVRTPRPGPAAVRRSFLAARLGDQPEQVSQTAPDPDRPHRRGARGGGGPGRGPRCDRLRRRRRHGAGLGRGDRAAPRPAADRPHRHRCTRWRWAGPGTAT